MMYRTNVLASLLLTLAALASQQALGADPPAAPRPLKMSDILAWKHLRAATVSNDGQWLAYYLVPNEGDGTLVLRQTRGDKELRFSAGKTPGFGELKFSHDSKWLAFAIYPTAKEIKLLKKMKKAPSKKAGLVELAGGKLREFDKVKGFTFSGEGAAWLALHRMPAETQALAAEKWSGSDLLLHELATGTELTLGNVAEHAFDKSGRWLALVIDAQGQVGNGVQLRNMTTSALVPLDTARASYRGLAWTRKGDGLIVLRGTEDKLHKEKSYSIVAFTGFGAALPEKVVFDPATEKTFPKGLAISANRPPQWTDSLDAILFGIQPLKKKKAGPVVVKVPGKEKGPKEPDAKKIIAGKAPPAEPGDLEAAELVIWHWQDNRLQSHQQKEEGKDRSHSYLCAYRVKDKRFLRLADRSLREVVPAPRARWAIGFDRRPYERGANLDGRRYQDVYVVDLESGARRLALRKNRWALNPSPDGSHFLYYEDGHFYTLELATGKTFNITRDTPTSFIDVEDDHNVVNPPRRPLGWARDGASVLLSDGWDIWAVPVHGGAGTNLTRDGKRDGVRYRSHFGLQAGDKGGIDLKQPVYFSVLGEWTKKSGIARLDPGKAGTTRLLWDDADFGGLLKAKDADVFLYTRQTCKDYPDYCVAGPDLKDGRKITHANPQQAQFLWTKGCQLVTYTSAKGAKLQAALFLPADYEPGKRYPTIVYIYEKLSGMMHQHAAPTARGFNPSVYTSNGYAVLLPDIVYQLNDPGKSAVWCVLPALEAAIATGVVDRERVALHGHSWGGYQTAFLITQTDAFKAAIAGAPLTNLVSMYSSIYWNTGWTNQPIFESSQGRFTSGYSENLDAFVRNSPVYHAKNVKTPLLLLHNDKDGAVDWNQGIEYYNTLRRLGKSVVMLQYKGENHGLLKPANQRDYTVRMREFFDHHLRDRPAPAWLREGVPHLEHDEHLKERVRELND
jgi:dipeptidyl aminopeptidase/acylaminoacyl peptidase